MALDPSVVHQTAAPGTLSALAAAAGRGRRHPGLPLRIPVAQDCSAARSAAPDGNSAPPGSAGHNHDATALATHIDKNLRPGRGGEPADGGLARRAEILDLESQTRLRRDPTQPPDPLPQTPALALQLKHLQFLLDPFPGTETRPTDEDTDAVPAAEAATRGGGGHPHSGAAAQHQARHSQLLQQLHPTDTPCVIQTREPPRAAALQEEGPHDATATEGFRPHPTRAGCKRDRNGSTGDRDRLHQRGGCTNDDVDNRASNSSGPGLGADAAPAAAAASCKDTHDYASDSADTDASSGAADPAPSAADRADTLADSDAAAPNDAPDFADIDADAADAGYLNDDADPADAVADAAATRNGMGGLRDTDD